MVLATTRYDPEQGPDVLFEGGGITVGHAAFPDTPDNVFRRVPLQVEGLRSFAAAAAAAAGAALPVRRRRADRLRGTAGDDPASSPTRTCWRGGSTPRR